MVENGGECWHRGQRLSGHKTIPIHALLTSHAKQREQLGALREAVTTICQVPPKGRDPGRVLTKQTPKDDVEAYLEVFERTAIREKWPEDEWGTFFDRGCPKSMSRSAS